MLCCFWEHCQMRRVWRYQRGNQNPSIGEEQKTQWPNKTDKMKCFEDTKGVIRSHRTDNTMVKRKRTNSDLRNITQKTNNRVVTLKTMASSSPVFSRVCVAQALVFCVEFVDHCLSFCLFSFDHCVVCSIAFDNPLGINKHFPLKLSVFVGYKFL